MKKLIYILLISFTLSGCSTPERKVNRSYPVLEDVGDGISYAYASNNEKPRDDSYKVLGEFSTAFNPKAVSRNENIRLAADNLNETIILPGEIFSYNETVGPTTKEKGYRLARIFIRGNERKGYGGGVCQVSTTLYNAALEAEMDIVERHPHSKEVKYVEKGKDAAVSYGGIDLKFANPYDVPVKINTDIVDDEIMVKIVAL